MTELERDKLAAALDAAEWGSQIKISRVVWSKNPGRDGRIWWPRYPIEMTERQRQRSPLPSRWKSSDELADLWASRPHLAEVIWGIKSPNETVDR